MNSILLESLINEATHKAYKNVLQWSDADIASQLRDGLRSVLEAFGEIDDQTDDPAVLLNQMDSKLQNVLSYYHNLPGDQGQWECSALNIVRNEIGKLIREKYTPLSEHLSRIKKEIENEIP